MSISDNKYQRRAERSYWRQHMGRLETSQAQSKHEPHAAPGDRNRIETPRRDGPAPYTRASLPQGELSKQEIQAHISKSDLAYGWNRQARRRYAWQHRTQKGLAELVAIEAARRLHLDALEMVPVGGAKP